MEALYVVTRCPHCQTAFRLKAEAVGRQARCAKCSQPFKVEPAQQPAHAAPAPHAASSVPAQASAGHAAAGDGLCAICQSPIDDGDTRTACPGCKAQYHAECWEYNKGCAVYGCSHVPATEHRTALEVPPAYCGKEDKNCPNCGQVILAAAVRCRHCGATFGSAAPQDSADFHRQAQAQENLPAVRRASIWLLIFSALSCTAPIAAIVGLVWYHNHRQEIRALPAMHGAICKIAVGVGVGQSVLLVVLCILYAISRG